MDRMEYLLFKLAEEGAEVTHRACKSARFGMMEVQLSASDNPNNLNNEQRLIVEINDLWAAVEELGLGECLDRELIDKAKAKLKKYMKYSEEKCGTLTTKGQ